MMINKIIKEWQLFKQDFHRQCNESFLFKFNWYVLKPLALIICLITLIIL